MYNTELSGAIAGYTKMNPGKLPAIAGNIPRLYYINLLSNILIILKYYYSIKIV